MPPPTNKNPLGHATAAAATWLMIGFRLRLLVPFQNISRLIWTQGTVYLIWLLLMNIIARRCQHQWVSWAPQVTVLPINGPDYHQHGNNSKMPFLFFTCTGKSDHLPSQDTTTVELANKNTIFPSLRNYYFFFLNNFSWWSTQGHPHNQCPQWIEVGIKQDNEKKSVHE